MRAVVADGAGGPEVLSVAEMPDPGPGPGEVAIATAATAVNRADVLQRKGFYPPPPGASEIIGLECSGTIAALGADAGEWQVGDEVCALLAGGGYASRVVVPAGQVMPVPAGVDLVTAAALPEVACTVWSNLYRTGQQSARLQPGETVLVHGGAGGVGSFAVQLASRLGSRVLTTAGTPEKRAFCAGLGAEVTIDYHEEDFVEVAREATDGRGADVILDNMAAKYLQRNLDALAPDGRLVVVGMQGGTKAELDLAKLLTKRASVTAMSLRGRSVADKSTICAEVVEQVWPLLADGSVRPVVGHRFGLDEVAEAHQTMDAGSHTGKILLTL